MESLPTELGLDRPAVSQYRILGTEYLRWKKPARACEGCRLSTRYSVLGIRYPLALLVLALTALSVGCVSLGSFLGLEEPASSTPVCQIVATWCHDVKFAPDPVRGGIPAPGLAGRLYLFGPQIDFPLIGDGSLQVDLYDEGPRAHGGEPQLLEIWRIDRDTLRRLLKRDTIGWGYTLFLPWGTYKPEITRVRLKLRYDPLKGTPLFTESGSLTLQSDGGATPPIRQAVKVSGAAESAPVPATPARPAVLPPASSAGPPPRR